MTDGSQGFLVTAQVTSLGTGSTSLPFANVFLMNITDPLNPGADALAAVASPLEIQRASNTTVYIKLDPTTIITLGADQFASVASISQFTQLARDRDTALARGQTQYLSPSVTFLYTDPVTATAAYQTILSRVSTLVSAWYQYQTSFLPNPPPFINYNLPQVSIGVEAQLVAAYTTAKQATATAQTAVNSAQAAVTACNASCACNQQILQLLTQDVTGLRATLDYVATLVEAATALVTVYPSTTVTVPPGYSVAVSQTSVTKSFITGGDARSIQTLYSQKVNALSAAQAAVNACVATCQGLQTTLLSTQAALTTAQANEATALAAVVAVCPTFNPASV
jgi:hypothetical protein